MPEKLTEKVTKTEAEWRQQLTPEQYHVTREAGTERAFTGKYWNNHEKGMYYCVGCGAPLFDSETKFESGTGWASFFAPADQQNVSEHTDRAYGMTRTEARCARCDCCTRCTRSGCCTRSACCTRCGKRCREIPGATGATNCICGCTRAGAGRAAST